MTKGITNDDKPLEKEPEVVDNETDSKDVTVIVTKHAKDRFKDRLGLPKRACEKQAQLALDKGFKHSDAKGKARKHIDNVFFKNKKANNIRVYGEVLYVFRNSLLITVLHFPSELTKFLKKGK